MAVGARERSVSLAFTSQIREQIAFWWLFGVLAAYTLTTMDGGDIAPGFVSAGTFLLTAFYFAWSFRQRLTIHLPVVCLLLMACYGVARALWPTQGMAYNGWTGVLFWFSAAAITLVGARIFQDRHIAARFRLFLVVFGSAVCVLDLLEQASHTSKYFWLIQSRYATVNGPFAYWNNFSQFIELVLPITLWLAVSRSKPAVPYLVLSGLQIGAVVASGSRAGSALAIAEFMAVMVIAYFRNRERTFLVAAASAVLVSVLFAYAAGLDTLSHKLQQRDQLAVRRDINASSVAMIRERPLTGWGLGTYVPVYRMFARYDDGTYVNRAHDDWLEWTAEGGIFFSAIMFAVFVWSIRPAIRSVWGIGVIALCLHATVDYPFARLGVCGWYFALIGMLSVTGEERMHRGVRRTERKSARIGPRQALR